MKVNSERINAVVLKEFAKTAILNLDKALKEKKCDGCLLCQREQLEENNLFFSIPDHRIAEKIIVIKGNKKATLQFCFECSNSSKIKNLLMNERFFDLEHIRKGVFLEEVYGNERVFFLKKW